MALITGGARRIGRAIAEGLASQGFAVAIHAHNSLDEAQALADALGRAGARAAAVDANLHDVESTAGLVEKAARALGPVDLLVNNASVFRDDGAGAFNAETFEAHFSVHVRAPSILAAAFAAALPANRDGLIVNIIDQRVWALTPRFYSYTLSKAALWTATQTMAQAFAPRIRVNAIGPGPTVPPPHVAPEAHARRLTELPLGRSADADGIADGVAAILTLDAMTGQMIVLDGGEHIEWPARRGPTPRRK